MCFAPGLPAAWLGATVLLPYVYTAAYRVAEHLAACIVASERGMIAHEGTSRPCNLALDLRLSTKGALIAGTC